MKLKKSETIKELQTLLPLLHLNLLKGQTKDGTIHIETPPDVNALAWYDRTTDLVYITNILSSWSVELLYVLVYHEVSHRICEGLVEHCINGYHTNNFRQVFENLSGMKTFHIEKIGWQFIAKVGEQYFEWLKDNRVILNKIFNLIHNTDLSSEFETDNDDSQDSDSGEQDTENDDSQDSDSGEQDTEQDITKKMNNILTDNLNSDESELIKRKIKNIIFDKSGPNKFKL